jgi:hypothetical protein
MQLRSDNTGAWRNIFHKGHVNDDRTPASWMHPKHNSILFIITSDKQQNEFYSTFYVTTFYWMHYTYRFDGSWLEFYADGNYDNGMGIKGTSIMNTGPFYVGGDPWYSNFGGYIDEFHIYQKALDGNEIAIMAGGGHVKDKTLLAWWDFSSFNDLTGNKHNLKLEGKNKIANYHRPEMSYRPGIMASYLAVEEGKNPIESGRYIEAGKMTGKTYA